jgi:palmitoyltransferase|tara:strand:- start:391 stop:651 length:261 start_codon:yes stop_codon:yes gene_type:complete
MALLSHIRGTFADPGLIPDNLELPDYVDTARLNICEKCDNKWKPERAHHCSECNKCVFKVSYSLYFADILFMTFIFVFRWITIVLG